jgi:hypothetical protein
MRHKSLSSRMSRHKLSQKLEEAARVQMSPLESIGIRGLERVTDPAREKRTKESIGVHMSQSSRMSRYKLNQKPEEAARVQLSPLSILFFVPKYI